MLTADEMRDEQQLIFTLTHDYTGKKLATTFYPVERIANLFAERPLARVDSNVDWTRFDAIVLDQTSQSNLIAHGVPVKSVGRYAIIEPAKVQP